MPYPTEVDLESAIAAIESALAENPQLRNAPAAWQAWQEVVAHLVGPVSADASYGALARDTSSYKGVI